MIISIILNIGPIKNYRSAIKIIIQLKIGLEIALFYKSSLSVLHWYV